MDKSDLDRLAAWIEKNPLEPMVVLSRQELVALLAHVRTLKEEVGHISDGWAKKLAAVQLDLDIAQGSHEHDCGIFQERWCTCRVANATVDAALLDRLIEAREWMDAVIHGGAKFAKGSTLVDGEHLLERIDAALMQEPAPVDAAAVERALRTRPDYDLRCDECGAPHNLDTSIPSDLWNQIAPRGGVLCTLCIDDKLTAAGLEAEAEFYYSGTALQSRMYDDGRRVADEVRAALRAARTTRTDAVKMCVCDHEWYAHFDHQPSSCKRCGCVNPTFRRATRTDAVAAAVERVIEAAEKALDTYSRETLAGGVSLGTEHAMATLNHMLTELRTEKGTPA